MTRTLLTIGILGSAMALAVALAPAQSNQARAAGVLRNAIESSGKVRMSAVQNRRPSVNAPEVRIMVEQSGDGSIRTETLQPICSQGIVTIDNGEIWVTFFPDKQFSVTHPSPQQFEPPIDQRMNRILRNYALDIAGETRVAGRRAVVIVATPRHSELPQRRFGIDQRNHAVLRQEQVVNGRPVRTLDTLTVSYPREISPVRFDPNVPANRQGKVVRAPEMRRPDGSNAGFRPLRPQALPFGFEVDFEHVVRIGRSNMVAYRISDGLSRATVYQWSSSNQGQPSVQVIGNTAETSRQGVQLRIVGDLPEPVLRRILESFRGAGLSDLVVLVVELD
ncbi:MAG: sigma-E factor regulatory protein RseB domain-containing protein [Fimbriimonadaceae bacterium]